MQTIPTHFVHIKTLAETEGLNIKSMYVVRSRDKKAGRTDRFIKVGKDTYVDRYYPLTKEEYLNIQKAKKLFYLLLDVYPNLYQLAVAFAKEIGCTKQAAYERLILGSFTRDTKKVIKIFEKLLGE